jgi:hypothetical protein
MGKRLTINAMVALQLLHQLASALQDLRFTLESVSLPQCVEMERGQGMNSVILGQERLDA